MNHLRRISIFAVLTMLVVYLVSCSEKEEAVQKPEAISYLLFNKIPLTPLQDGGFSFVDDKEEVRVIIEEFLITKNHALTQIDDFGFTQDDLGYRYFYVREKNENGSKTLYASFSKEGVIVSSEELTQRGPVYVPMTICLTDRCCDDCRILNNNCECTRLNWECMQNMETIFSCVQREIIIIFF